MHIANSISAHCFGIGEDYKSYLSVSAVIFEGLQSIFFVVMFSIICHICYMFVLFLTVKDPGLPNPKETLQSKFNKYITHRYLKSIIVHIYQSIGPYASG